ncbi:hypothetical protein MRY87_11685 [bacterium]|nr:hypothetical protein [bacterium]
MPITLGEYTDSREGHRWRELAWLCDNEWELPNQLKALEDWLLAEGKQLPVGKYSADIGFSPRNEATGGGGYLSCRALKVMSDIGMDLFFSEYPEMIGD